VSQPSLNEVHYLIAEAIDAVATPEVRDRVITRSLELSNSDEVPDQGREVRVFIREYLAAALAESFEADTVEGIVDTLSPLMERTTGAEMTGLNRMPELGPPAATPPFPAVIQSTLRVPEGPKLRLASPPQPPEGTLRTVVLFSAVASKAAEIEASLGDGAPVLHASNSLAMLDALRDHGADGAVVVVDCVEPSVEPWALIALGGQIAPEARMLFWGPLPDLELELAHLDGRRWRTVGPEVSAAQIARICCALVRGPTPT